MLDDGLIERIEDALREARAVLFGDYVGDAIEGPTEGLCARRVDDFIAPGINNGRIRRARFLELKRMPMDPVKYRRGRRKVASSRNLRALGWSGFSRRAAESQRA